MTAHIVNKLPPADRRIVARLLEGVDTQAGVAGLADELRAGEAASQALTATQRENITRRANWLDVVADAMDHAAPEAKPWHDCPPAPALDPGPRRRHLRRGVGRPR